jgi:hypothetical protein
VWFAHRAVAEPAPAAAPAVTVERAEQLPALAVPPRPEQAPQLPPIEPQPGPVVDAEPAAEERPERPERLTIRYSDPRCAVIRALYDDGYRPTTTEMRTALEAAGHTAPSPSGLRGVLRAEVERHEPHLAELPGRPTPLHRAG